MVVQIIPGLHWLGNLVFAGFFVPAKPVLAIFLQNESVAGGFYISATVLN